VALLLALVLAAAGAVLVLERREAPGGSATSAGRSAEHADRTIRDATVRRILARRAAAVRDKDRSAFMADVSRDARFRAEQRRLFDNLAQVRFTAWDYELVDAPYNDPSLERKYRRPYHLASVLLRYQLADFDAAPVARPQGLTFAFEDGAWALASDSDLDTLLPQPGRADPWDRRAVVVVDREDALLFADAADEASAEELADVAQDAVDRVASVWPKGWRRKVVILAVRDERMLESYFQYQLASSDDVAAIAAPVYGEVPGWSSRADEERDWELPQRSRVVINPRYFDPEDPYNIDLLTHEIVHVATQHQTWAGAPTWLTEGSADYVAWGRPPDGTVPLPRRLRKQVKAGAVELPTYWFYDRNVRSNYVVAYLAAAHIADRYGVPALRRLYRRLGRTASAADTGTRQARGVRDVLGVSVEELRRDIAAYALVKAI
jgi:hypothetical protein